MASVSPSSPVGDPSEVRSGGPVLFLTVSGLLWLLAGILFSLLAWAKLMWPTLASEVSFLTYGRVRGAADACLLYGFAAQTGMGVALWLLARLGGKPLPAGGLAGIAVAFWNVALTLGVPGILGGQGTGVRWMELPAESAPLLFLSQLTLAVLGLVLFFQRSTPHFTVAQRFLLVSLFWFPWIDSTAQVALVFLPVRGVIQAIIAGWFSQLLFLVWLTSLALAILFALLPELSGKPTRHPLYAMIGFWSWLVLSGWTAGSTLVGGPVPAWIPTLSVASGVLLIIPTVLLSLSLHTGASLRSLLSSPALLLASVSGMAFTVSGALFALTSFRCAREILQFTQFFTGLQQLTLLGFAGWAFLAAIYVMVPRVLGRQFPFPILSFLHVAGSVAGVGLAVLPLLVGGWIQGWALNSQTDLVKITHDLQPWLVLNALGLLVLAGSQLALMVNVAAAAVQFLMPFGKPALDWALAPTTSVANK